MKKSFMTRVLAVSLSTAMAFSLSPVSNLTTASAASTVQISTTFKTVKVGQSATLKLKNNTLDWKISKVKTTDKTTCTVYGKTASNVKIKGKKVGRATITITATSAKRKKKGGVSTKNMKCRANVIAAEAAFSATATASSNTSATVTFSEAVDAATLDNFAISGGSARISEVALSADKKSATLTLAGTEASTEYTLTTTGLSVGGKAVANQTIKFKTPDAQVAETKAALVLTSDLEKPYLKADGNTSTVITCEIRDAEGKVMENADVEVRFTTTRGNLGSERVAAQKGIAKTTLRSEFLQANARTVITATVVESRTNPELINSSGTMDITMTPNPDDYVTTTGAVITSAESNQADRVTAFFNQEVNVDDYLYANKTINPNKVEILVKDAVNNSYNINTGNSINVIGLAPVKDNKNAMELILEHPLTDNANVGVQFKDKTGTQTTNNDVFFKLTDARQLAALQATGEGYRTIVADFSEPVLNMAAVTGAQNANSTRTNYVADAENGASHFQIDGVAIDGAKFGFGETKAKATVGEFKNGEDNRSKVTIKLGKDADGKRRYLTPGKHSLQIVNVGDWAAYTDRNNVLQTQTLDFEVAEDNTLPDIQSVVVQSPEQYLVTFASPVDTRILGRKDDGTRYLRLEYNDGGWKDVEKNQPTSSLEAQEVKIKAVGVAEGADEFQQCIVEVKTDWTKFFNTTRTNDNYYRHSFRLSIDKGELENTNNGKTNGADINHALTGDMIARPDNESPVIGEIEEKTDANGNVYYSVPMNEPVKIIDKDGVANAEGKSPSQLQGTDIPKPHISFIRESDFKTIDGELLGFDRASETNETYDHILKVQPKDGETLSNGKWILVVRSISDDVGNTAASLTKSFESNVVSKEQTFKVLWAAVANKYFDGKDTNVTDVATYDDIICNGTVKDKYGTTGTYIFVKFSDAIQVSGASANVLATENYVLNGRPLPANTRILANIKGYDGEKNAETDSITIVLPNNEYVYGVNTMLNISTAVESKSGKRLSGENELRLPYRLGHDHNDGEDPKSDAIWGNDDSEKNVSNYKKAVQEALDDDSYSTVIITNDVEGAKFTVSRPVNIISDGYPIDSIDFKYTKGGRSTIENMNGTSMLQIGNITVDTPNASFHILGENENIVVDNIVINGIANETFLNRNAKIQNLDLLGDDAHIVNSGLIGKMTVKAKRPKLDNEKTIGDITIQAESEKVRIANAAGATIGDALIQAAGTTVDNNGSITKTTVDTTGTVTLDSEKGGTYGTVVAKKAATIQVTREAKVTTLHSDAAGVKVVVSDKDSIGSFSGQEPAITDGDKNEIKPDDDQVIKDEEVKDAGEAAKDYFVSPIEVATTSTGAISITNKSTTTTEGAVSVSKISVLGADKKAASKNMTVDNTVVAEVIKGEGDINEAVTLLKERTTGITEYIVVEGTIKAEDGKEIGFKVEIEVKF